MSLTAKVIHPDGTFEDVSLVGAVYEGGVLRTSVSAWSDVQEGDILRVEFPAHAHLIEIDHKPVRRICLESHAAAG